MLSEEVSGLPFSSHRPVVQVFLGCFLGERYRCFGPAYRLLGDGDGQRSVLSEDFYEGPDGVGHSVLLLLGLRALLYGGPRVVCGEYVRAGQDSLPVDAGVRPCLVGFLAPVLGLLVYGAGMAGEEALVVLECEVVVDLGVEVASHSFPPLMLGVGWWRQTGSSRQFVVSKTGVLPLDHPVAWLPARCTVRACRGTEYPLRPCESGRGQ